MTAAKRPRPVGRPPAPDQRGGNARAAILDAASRQFAEHGIKATTNQMIARDAGVTPAMVHYYFRRREVLYRAVLDELLAPLVERLPRIASLEDWVEAFHGFLTEHPWAPQLMVREVFMHNGLLRPWFIRDYGPAIFGRVRELIVGDIGADRQEQIDVERHIMLLQAMLVFPFLGLEVGEKLTGRKFDTAMMTAFRDDALQLFRQGIGAGRKTRRRK